MLCNTFSIAHNSQSGKPGPIREEGGPFRAWLHSWDIFLCQLGPLCYDKTYIGAEENDIELEMQALLDVSVKEFKTSLKQKSVSAKIDEK